MTRTLDEAHKAGETPWQDVLVETRDYTVFRDAYPVTEGHVLFVPKQEDWQHVTKCWEAAYKWGTDWVEREYCDAFNIGMNVGEAAGQTVCYPHIHLIPRRTGDMSNPEGGVRHVIPHKGNYKKGETMEDYEVELSEKEDRRLFYIDVGDMSYEQMTAYMDSVKSKFEKKIKGDDDEEYEDGSSVGC